MRTNELIESLVSDLKPTQRPGMPGLLRFLAVWTLASGAIFGLIGWLLPKRQDLAARASEGAFWIESGLWLSVSFLAVILSHRSLVPGAETSGQRRAFLGATGLGLAALAYRMSWANLTSELLVEMDLTRSYCGAFILAAAALLGLAGFSLARRGAPTELRLTGAWITVAVGAYAGCSMQFICAYESAAHVLVWHALPVGLAAGWGAWAGERRLKWRGSRIAARG